MSENKKILSFKKNTKFLFCFLIKENDKLVGKGKDKRW